MIPAALVALAPVLDPRQRWCQGLGRARCVVSIGRMYDGRFHTHPSIHRIGGGIRLCHTCVEVAERQIVGSGYIVRILEMFSESVLTRSTG